MAIEQDCPRPAVLLISRGWDFDGWSAFYPDDLPVEWRLAYYANEFKGVLVPEPAWLTGEAVWDWAGEVQEGFLFYLELTGLDPGREARLTEVARVLGPNLGGVFYTGDPGGVGDALQHLFPDAGPRGSENTSCLLRTALNAVGGVATTTKYGHVDALHSQDIVAAAPCPPRPVPPSLRRETFSQPLWLMGNIAASDPGMKGCATDMAALGNGAVTAFYIGGDVGWGLKEMRGLIEVLEQRGSSASPALLILGGDPPDLLLLNRCRILLNLMGVA